MVRVSLPSNTPGVMYEPRERNVFISGDSGNETAYFEQFNLTKGLLQPSCCSPDDVTLSCPGVSTQTISLLAPCQWGTTNSKVTRTVGAVFAQSNSFFLPISLSGLRYRDTPGRSYINDIRQFPIECQLCDECRDDTDGVCYCYTHTPQHTQEFLQARALAYTYITQIQHLLPSWSEILVDLDMSLESSASSKNDLFAPITLSSEPVSSFEGCSKLTNLVGSRYSVMRYDKTLSAVIDGQRYDYRENTETGTTGDVMCFAVDLCHESESPVHMQISQPINDILVSQYLRHFTSDRQWNILIHTVSLYRQPVTLSSDTRYWNGMEMTSLPVIEVDVSVDANCISNFDENELGIKIYFVGKASFNYMVSVIMSYSSKTWKYFVHRRERDCWMERLHWRSPVMLVELSRTFKSVLPEHRHTFTLMVGILTNNGYYSLSLLIIQMVILAITQDMDYHSQQAISHSLVNCSLHNFFDLLKSLRAAVSVLSCQ